MNLEFSLKIILGKSTNKLNTLKYNYDNIYTIA